MAMLALLGSHALGGARELVLHIDGTLRLHGARSRPTPMDLVHASSSRPPFAQMSTVCLESDRVERAVLSHVHAAPGFEAVSLVIHPRRRVDAPLLALDMRAFVGGRARLDVDALGPAAARPAFMHAFHAPLARVLDELPRGVRKRPLPWWLEPISGGCGASLEVARRERPELESILLRYVEVYLGALAEAGPAPTTEGHHAVGDVFAVHSAAGAYRARAFGTAFAERYDRLLWGGA